MGKGKGKGREMNGNEIKGKEGQLKEVKKGGHLVRAENRGELG